MWRKTAMQPDFRQLAESLAPEHIESATRLGLTFTDNLDRDTWSRIVCRITKAAGEAARGADTFTAWLGDLLAYGGGKYRGQIAQYAKAAGMTASNLRNAKLVCSRIPVSCRHDTLSWSHHCEVGKAFESIDDITHWLKLAADEQLSRMALRKRIREHKKSVANSAGSAAVDMAPFKLLRELRAAERLVRDHGHVWRQWPPHTCKRALDEIGTLAGFVSDLNARTAEEAANPEAS